ncbi:3-deoxy-D-manno-octulosonic acid transferase [Rubripirellula amarantea]|uniref:3-deoxy-D-manno-octulosonic acid transferase n=1 Tax=Rubripirellula amarantea TaxID=2527999 RepID=A0A5C5WW36_9BACT|nr:3-deoxy-D-manno-octulosonic acid transferase [Rubripirellula amarantea]TWT54193.1 3-deoxy-D-manno-octulosonic acid transferase [Rubripirellula amarantea]
MLFNLLYAALLAAVSPIVAYRMVRHGRYRRGLGEKLLGLSKTRAKQLRAGKECLWIHAVSVGEVNLLPSVVKQIESLVPDASIVISSSTDTGYDLAVQRFGAERVFFCPLDFTWAVSRTLRHLKPKQVILTELELWPNLIRLASKAGHRVKVINGRLSSRSSERYQQFGFLTRPSFERLHWVGCQDEAALARFEACGVAPSRLSVTGSIKFDNAPMEKDTPEVQELVQWSGVDPWHRVWVVGSTQDGEESMAIEIYQRLRVLNPELRLILVPRHAERFDTVASLLKKSGLNVHRRSCDGSLFSRSWDVDTVVLVDTIGELRNWWGVANIATVGGSFGSRGGQNMLEPAGYGVPVSFGPNTKNFATIADSLIEADAAVRVVDEQSLERFVRRCLSDIPAADSLGENAKAVVAKHRGAIKQTVDHLLHEKTAQQDSDEILRAA